MAPVHMPPVPTQAAALSARYTRTAMALHWAMAVLVCGQLASGAWMVRAIDDAERFAAAFSAYQMHKSVGIVLLALAIMRLGWRLLHRPPADVAAKHGWQRIAARGVHAALYALMIAVPLAGWMVASASPFGLPTQVFDLFGWPHLPVSTALEPTAKQAHRTLAYLFAALCAGHIVAALKHAIVERDDVMRRMLPRI